jgi:hypothetical protein
LRWIHHLASCRHCLGSPTHGIAVIVDGQWWSCGWQWFQYATLTPLQCCSAWQWSDATCPKSETRPFGSLSFGCELVWVAIRKKVSKWSCHKDKRHWWRSINFTLARDLARLVFPCRAARLISDSNWLSCRWSWSWSRFKSLCTDLNSRWLFRNSSMVIKANVRRSLALKWHLKKSSNLWA